MTDHSELRAEAQAAEDALQYEMPVPPQAVLALLDEIDRLKANAQTLQAALIDIQTQVDGNIRETVRDCVNGHNDVQDIYGYCEAIEAIIEKAIAGEVKGSKAMRIVNLDTFLAMPPGTVFCKYESCNFDELMIKDESSPTKDFYYVSPTDEVDCSSCGERMGILESSEETGDSFPLHFNTVSRDGMYEAEQLFAVWERKDVVGLIGRLQQALQDGYGCPLHNQSDCVQCMWPPRTRP
jgi:hypothetical protein